MLSSPIKDPPPLLRRYLIHQRPLRLRLLPRHRLPRQHPLPAGQGNLMIQDPLGDPIPSGTIAFGSESITFSSGKVIVPATAPHELSVRVSADGYMPGEFTINPNSSSLVLDYLCDFSIFTEDEKGKSCPHILLSVVWKSNNSTPGQLGDQATVLYPNKKIYHR